MLLDVQFANEGVVHALYNLHYLTFAATASATGKECHTYKVVGECMCRVALADEYRLTAVLGVELVVAVLAARECTEQHRCVVGKYIFPELGLHEVAVKDHVVKDVHAQCPCRC